jgi:molybdenum cofactor biosynthesis protein B
MSHAEHDRRARDVTPQCAVVTLSDTRTPQTDSSGAAIKRHLIDARYEVATYAILPDEPQQLTALLTDYLKRDTIDVIICNGGTGVSRRDQTIDAIESLIQTPLPGFGEIFRQQSFAQIGPAAMLSRATAGVANGRVLFALPGSTPAVELAMTLITPLLRHLVFELGK